MPIIQVEIINNIVGFIASMKIENKKNRRQGILYFHQTNCYLFGIQFR